MTTLKSAVVTLLLVATTSVTPGCATVFAGGASEMHVVLADPVRDATIEAKSLNGRDDQVVKGYDLHLRFRKDTDYLLSIHQEGFKPQTVPVVRSITPWFWANIAPLAIAVLLSQSTNPLDIGYPANAYTALASVIAIPIFAGIDLITGNIWTHDPAERRVTMQPAS